MKRLEADVPGIPRDQGGPVFREPWEAHSFAMAVALQRAGWFQWHQWSAMLSEEIGRAQAAGDADAGDTYYRHWQATLERMIVERGLSDVPSIGHYRSAWERAARRTPHGTPIELEPDDFSGATEQAPPDRVDACSSQSH